MPIPIDYKTRAEPAESEPTVSDLKLRQFVLKHVGRPDDLVKVDVKHLWGGSFRLNMYRRLQGRSVLTDSFFVQAVDDGIVASPPIDRRYHPQAVS